MKPMVRRIIESFKVKAYSKGWMAVNGLSVAKEYKTINQMVLEQVRPNYGIILVFFNFKK